MPNFQFKKFIWDFIVEEKLKDYPTGNGPVLYVFFEKANMTTFDVINFLMRRFGLQRNNIGIAGLKDKQGITRQRLSIYRSNLAKIGGKETFLNELSKKVKILRTSWGEKSLTMGANLGNLFFIRLRNIRNTAKEKLPEALEYISTHGVPNYFGEQRFGKGGKNYEVGKKILFGGMHNVARLSKEDFIDQQFKVQAFSSYMYNQYVDKRLSLGKFDDFIKGDILYNYQKDVYKIYKGEKIKQIVDSENSIITNVMPSGYTLLDDDGDYDGFVQTGPIFGFNLFVSGNFDQSYRFSYTSDSLKLELDILKANGLGVFDLAKYKFMDIYGLRRQIKLNPKDIRVKYDKNDVLLMFELPSGAYATVIIDAIDKMVDSGEPVREKRN